MTSPSLSSNVRSNSKILLNFPVFVSRRSGAPQADAGKRPCKSCEPTPEIITDPPPPPGDTGNDQEGTEPSTTGEIKIAAFNIQVFRKAKREKPDVMAILGEHYKPGLGILLGGDQPLNVLMLRLRDSLSHKVSPGL